MIKTYYIGNFSLLEWENKSAISIVHEQYEDTVNLFIRTRRRQNKNTFMTLTHTHNPNTKQIN